MASCGGHRPQLVRLLQLLLYLQSGRCPNARELARHCEVSRRTVFRDLEALERAGIPVTYRPDRQGYQLAPEFASLPPNLEGDEAASLVLLARWGRSFLGPELGRAAETAVLKCVEGLPAAVKPQLRTLAERVESRDFPQGLRREREGIYVAIVHALARGQQVRLHYLDPASDRPIVTRFVPFRLVLDRGVWCLVGRSIYHRAVRSIRVPQIQRIEPTPETADVPPRFRSETPRRSPEVMTAHLRFSARVAPEVADSLWSGAREFLILPDGRLELWISTRDRGGLRRWILGFGDGVEVLAPESLRRSVGTLARRIARTYAPARCR